MTGPVRSRLRRHGIADDAGTTLLELIVGMSIMTIFMTMFTTAVYELSRSTEKVGAISSSADQVNRAFLQLDKMVRYSAAITTAGRSGGRWYVELDNTANGPEVCTQLRIDPALRQLQERTWTVAGQTAGTASAWVVLADEVTNGDALATDPDAPFTVPAASAAASSSFQQLTITVVTRSGTGTPATTRSRMTFTALNSAAASPTNDAKCQQKGRP